MQNKHPPNYDYTSARRKIKRRAMLDQTAIELGFDKWATLETTLKKSYESGDFTDVMVKILSRFTSEQRINIFFEFCQHCGDKDRNCQCMNDE